jgi:hypothetical protein
MAKDVFHQQVKNALIKDGWIITNDPLTIRISEVVKVHRTYATGTVILWHKSQESRVKGQKFRFFGLLTFDSGQT